MAKYLVKFNNKEYLIDETKFEPAISRLAAHLTAELQGSGATVTLGGVSYSLNGDKINTASAGFADYLETIAGTDMKATVGGQEYGLSRNALEDSIETVELTLAILADGDTPVEPAEPELTPSEGLEFELNDDGQSYYVSGIGTCTDNEVVIPSYYNDLPVTDIYVASKGRGPLNKENIYSIVLPNTFTKISDSLFSMHPHLKSVTIPNSITTIEDMAFNECGIMSVTIPDSVTSIGEGAFALCAYLTSVTIPNSVTSIGEYAFWNCISLTSVIIPNSVTSIGEDAFFTEFDREGHLNIYIDKPEGSISGAPWGGTTNATIHWNSTGPESN